MTRTPTGRRTACLVAMALGLLVATLPSSSSAQQSVDPVSAPVIGGETLLRGDFVKAIDSLTHELDAPGLTNDQRAGLFNDRGVAHWRKGDLGAALEDFNKAATIYPELAAVYSNRGNTLLALQSPTEAVRDFDRAVLLAPSYAAAYNNRAIAEVQLDQLDAAIADFSKAAELAPNAPAPINGRGKVHLDLNRPYLALRDFSRAIAIEPSYRPGYRNRALARLSLHQYAVAIDDLTNALTIAPNDPGLLFTRGLAGIAAQNYPAALADLDKLVAATPKSTAAFAERGHAYALLGSFPEAMNDFAKAIELDPKNREAYVHRAEAHLASNEAELGLADADRALKIDQRFVAAYRVRARIEEALGHKPDAAADFEQAASLDPQDQEAWDGLKRLTGKTQPPVAVVSSGQLPGWSVVQSGDRLLAHGDKLPELSIPLELIGTDAPQLTGWEEKGAPYKGIGVLRYLAGQMPAKPAPEAIELAVIIDLIHRQVLGIEPYRTGDRAASWTWTESGELLIKGPDGVNSNFRLAESLGMGQRSAGPGAPAQTHKQVANGPPPHKKKAFTLFDLFFN